MPVTQLPIEHMPLRFLSIYGPFDRAGTLNSARVRSDVLECHRFHSLCASHSLALISHK